MRDLILKMSISIDGFVSDLDGRNTWMFGADQEAKAWGVEFIWNSSLHIMGSRSFRDMAAWWPNLHRPVRGADEPDPQSRLLTTGTGVPEEREHDGGAG
ncbi:dihydrofolate reductase family protein [Mesorhizobium sp. M0166]|uniref:hypothetical protein n=1 Tax=unclassified Mesorhizobium TaxID=325217 RepID=UPI00333AE68A